MSDQSVTSYNKVAVTLHWLMAIGFFMMLGSGVAMSYFELPQSLKFNLYQWHKSGGVILLLAFVVRLGWRFVSKHPGLPESFSKIDITLAKLGHFGLYALMIAMPVTGWVMVSASVYGLPTIVFNLFQWPHIPGIAGNETIHALAQNAHFYLAILFALTIAAHIAAVIKHAVKDRVNLLPRMWFMLPLLILLPTHVQAETYTYTIDHAQSTVSFSGTHAGNDFEGVFEAWSAAIDFNPDDLAGSSISATFQMESAKTGDQIYDGTLPAVNWFDIENYPQGRFESTGITANADGSYQMTGDLTLRNITRPVTFAFILSDLAASPVTVSATFPIQRLDFDIGKIADPDAVWVSKEIMMTLSLVATKP